MKTREDSAKLESCATVAAQAVGSPRDVGVDSLRGLAVLLMIGANLSPYLLNPPVPFWFRLVATFCAPTFVMLAGLMIGEGSLLRPRPLSFTIKRASVLLAIAVIIDYGFWRLDPFVGFDILYLIGVALPLMHLVVRWGTRITCASSAAIFGLTPWLWQVIGYGVALQHPVLSRLQACFLDGWFPVFPWLGVGLFGAYLGRLRQKLAPAQARDRVLWIGLALGVVGTGHWVLTNPPSAMRGGYAELFYPPTIGPLFVMLSMALLLLWGQTWTGLPRALRFLLVFGRASLLAYILHIAVIALVLRRSMTPGGFGTFFVVYTLLAASVFGAIWALKRHWPQPKAFLGRLLLGG